ncbi:flavodoxin family protein [Candidatus Uhrbacteria bacterium]|nr:MAG: flavodoxin family protein [Candidatus Uhrbacteria bacterium]
MSENPFSRIEQDRERMLRSVEYLRSKSKILFLTTSNRWLGEKQDLPKSTMLANKMAEMLGDKVTVIDVTTLKVYPCEGNVSTGRGNTCGEKGALLDDKEKNPSGCHRCYASMNNPDDELWEISKPLLESDAVVFFGSVRWGQMNAFYQKLIERLTWLENRHSTLGESNVLANIDAGLIAVGHNLRGKEVVDAQKRFTDFLDSEHRVNFIGIGLLRRPRMRRMFRIRMRLRHFVRRLLRVDLLFFLDICDIVRP